MQPYRRTRALRLAAFLERTVRISVIIPTYRRVDCLRRCLDAIAAQHRTPDEIIVTVRSEDVETMSLLKAGSIPHVTPVTVVEGGVVAAMNAGLDAAAGDVIALTDDDAGPWADWLSRIEAAFLGDERLGGLGGLDRQGPNGSVEDRHERNPGELRWWGRLTSGHHSASPGPPREVVVVKGVNSAYLAGPLRKIGFDKRLRGRGAQVHWELSLGLALRRRGWKIVFDPSIGVDHFPAPRLDDDQRCQVNFPAIADAVHNETMLLYEHLSPVRRAVFFAWFLLVGTRGAPGLLQIPRLVAIRDKHVAQRWAATVHGRWTGLRAAITACP